MSVSKTCSSEPTFVPGDVAHPPLSRSRSTNETTNESYALKCLKLENYPLCPTNTRQPTKIIWFCPEQQTAKRNDWRTKKISKHYNDHITPLLAPFNSFAHLSFSKYFSLKKTFLKFPNNYYQYFDWSTNLWRHIVNQSKKDKKYKKNMTYTHQDAIDDTG